MLGTAGALAIARSRARWARICDVLFTLPLIGRGIGAGAFLAFMASFDNVPVSLFLADERTEVLPIHLWQQIDTNLDVRTAAVSGLIVMATIVLMILAERFAGLSRQLSK